MTKVITTRDLESYIFKKHDVLINVVQNQKTTKFSYYIRGFYDIEVIQSVVNDLSKFDEGNLYDESF